MLPHKTPKAHAALAQRTASLSLVERRALIVSNGQRSLDEIVGLLGRDALAAIDRLLRDGYLAVGEAQGSTLDSAMSVLKSARQAVGSVLPLQGSLRTAPSTEPAAPMPSNPAPPPAAATSSAAPASRRSLAASKMYVIGLLQLLRNADAVALAAALQANREPDGMVDGMLEALRHIQATCNPSYTRRVSDRLAEILPEEYLPAMQAARAHALQASA